MTNEDKQQKDFDQLLDFLLKRMESKGKKLDINEFEKEAKEYNKEQKDFIKAASAIDIEVLTSEPLKELNNNINKFLRSRNDN